MAGLSGTADKKRVAWGNFTFNLVTCLVVFIFLPWLVSFIQDIVCIKDPLIGLVFLQTNMNMLTILLFLPFINLFANWLSKRFKKAEENRVANSLSIENDQSTTHPHAYNISRCLNDIPNYDNISVEVFDFTE